MRFRFTYDNYQDVRHNLFLYSIPVLMAAGFFAYKCILPSTTRAKLDQFFECLPASFWLEGISGTVLFSCISFVLTEILQIHDRWYDRYIIKWRFRYATDFILPRLIQPFSSNINRRFHEVAEEHPTVFLEKLFYPYVQDRGTKIEKNKLVRFYEVVTRYWLTQINEIVLLLLFTFIAICRFFGPHEASFHTSLLDSSIILVVVFVLNRAWIRSDRERVRRATDAEIDAIIQDHKENLGGRIRRLCSQYGIQYE